MKDGGYFFFKWKSTNSATTPRRSLNVLVVTSRGWLEKWTPDVWRRLTSTRKNRLEIGTENKTKAENKQSRKENETKRNDDDEPRKVFFVPPAPHSYRHRRMRRFGRRRIYDGHRRVRRKDAHTGARTRKSQKKKPSGLFFFRATLAFFGCFKPPTRIRKKTPIKSLFSKSLVNLVLR